MKGNYLMRGLLVLAGMLLTGVSIVMAEEVQTLQTLPEIPGDKAVIMFTSSKLGDVTFLHLKHSTLQDVGGVNKVDCGTCHHDFKESGTLQDCHDCHAKKKGGLMENAPSFKDAFHLRCRGCHKYTMETLGKVAGPDKKCKLCHIKPGK